nr:hypothetical protein [Tanacetum cinerariifolium]
CCLFQGDDNKDLDFYPVCNTSRWKDSSIPEKKVPKKVLRYFPIIPRLQCLYKSSHTAKEMIWHATKKCMEPGKMQHPVDGRAWKNFVTKYLDFTKEQRNVRLGLAVDGFNPFGNLSQAYIMWPVILTTYNLPSWLCMKESSVMLTLLIPGPKSPGKDIDVYLRPLIEDLKDDMLKAQIKVVDILCDLELIYPPALFDIMIHLVIHLPLEALEAKPEGSIAKGYVAEEALTFSSHYFWDVTTKFNRPDRNMDPPPPKCLFQVFRSVCKSIGLWSVIRFDAQELKKVKWYVLHKSPEIDTYRSQFKSLFPNKDIKEEFPDWFGSQIRQRHVNNDKDPEVSTTSELFALACGPIRTPISINSCIVDGVRYVVHNRDERRITQNNDICSPDPDGEILNDLDNAALHIDGQSTEVDVPPDIIIDVVDEDDDITNDEDALPHDLAEFDNEDLINVDDDGVDKMSADVARSHGGDGRGEDLPLHTMYPAVAWVTSLTKPNLGGRAAGRLNTHDKTRNLSLKEITDTKGPVPIQFELRDKQTVMPLGDHAAHWSSYIGEVIRGVPLYYPSWMKVPKERKAALITDIRTQFDLRSYMESPDWTETNAGIQQHLQKAYNTNKAAFKAQHWVIKPTTGTYNVEKIRRERPENITASEWDKYIEFWNDTKNIVRAAQNRQNRAKSTVISR